MLNQFNSYLISKLKKKKKKKRKKRGENKVTNAKRIQYLYKDKQAVAICLILIRVVLFFPCILAKR